MHYNLFQSYLILNRTCHEVLISIILRIVIKLILKFLSRCMFARTVASPPRSRNCTTCTWSRTTRTAPPSSSSTTRGTSSSTTPILPACFYKLTRSFGKLAQFLCCFLQNCFYVLRKVFFPLRQKTVKPLYSCALQNKSESILLVTNT